MSTYNNPLLALFLVLNPSIYDLLVLLPVDREIEFKSEVNISCKLKAAVGVRLLNVNYEPKTVISRLS